jgi:hypothetical protein
MESQAVGALMEEWKDEAFDQVHFMQPRVDLVSIATARNSLALSEIIAPLPDFFYPRAMKMGAKGDVLSQGVYSNPAQAI